MVSKLILNLKVNRTLRIVSLVVIASLVLLLILASTRDLGKYVFNVGTSEHSSIIKTIITTDAKGVAKTTYEFNDASKNPIMGGLLYGSQSSVKVALALSAVAFIAAIAQIAKLFNKKYINKNFVNSVVILVSLVIAVGFSSHIAALIVGVVAIMIQSVLLTTSIFIEYKSKEMV